jgi:hypothetical protein
MYRFFTVLVSLLLGLAVAVPPAIALPSYLGHSGLILMPDGQLTHFQSLSFSAHFFDFSGTLRRYGIDGSTNVFAVNYSPLPALEVGFSSLDSDIGGRSNLLNGKVVLIPESEIQPFALAAGVVDALDEQEISPYAILSKSINLSGPTASNQIGFSLNAGYGGGFYDDGFMLGGEIMLTPQLSLLAEGTKRYINFGARFKSQGLALDIGFIDAEDFAGGLSYSILWK